MPRLTLPGVRFHASCLDAVREFTGADQDPVALLSEEPGPYETSRHEPEGFAVPYLQHYGGHIGYAGPPECPAAGTRNRCVPGRAAGLPSTGHRAGPDHV